MEAVCSRSLLEGPLSPPVSWAVLFSRQLPGKDCSLLTGHVQAGSTPELCLVLVTLSSWFRDLPVESGPAVALVKGPFPLHPHGGHLGHKGKEAPSPALPGASQRGCMPLGPVCWGWGPLGLSPHPAVRLQPQACSLGAESGF